MSSNFHCLCFEDESNGSKDLHGRLVGVQSFDTLEGTLPVSEPDGLHVGVIKTASTILDTSTTMFVALVAVAASFKLTSIEPMAAII